MSGSLCRLQQQQPIVGSSCKSDTHTRQPLKNPWPAVHPPAPPPSRSLPTPILFLLRANLQHDHSYFPCQGICYREKCMSGPQAVALLAARMQDWSASPQRPLPNPSERRPGPPHPPAAAPPPAAAVPASVPPPSRWCRSRPPTPAAHWPPPEPSPQAWPAAFATAVHGRSPT